MARVRIPDDMRDRVKDYVREAPDYDTQSEFVKDAVRRLLDQKDEPEVDEQDRKAIREIVKEELKKQP